MKGLQEWTSVSWSWMLRLAWGTVIMITVIQMCNVCDMSVCGTYNPLNVGASSFFVVGTCTVFYVDSTDADEIWKRLTDSERREFEELLSKGKLADMLDTHTPWWQVSMSVCSVLPATPTSSCVLIALHLFFIVII